LSGRGLCDELITRPEESYRLCCVVVCDLETSRMGAPYIYDISRLRVKHIDGVVIRIIVNVNVRYLSSCFFQNYSYFCRYLLNTRLWLIWRRTRIIVNDITKPFFLGSVAKWTFKTAFYSLPTSRVKSLTRNHDSLKLCRFVVFFAELLSELSNVKLIINHTGQFQQNLNIWFNDASCFAVGIRSCVQLWWQPPQDGGT